MLLEVVGHYRHKRTRNLNVLIAMRLFGVHSNLFSAKIAIVSTIFPNSFFDGSVTLQENGAGLF
jgi:hypothetical protein